MFLVGILSWWYGRGWLGQWRRVSGRWRATVEYFSIGQLMATLFAPFRQISASPANAANPVTAIKALFDQLVSRVVGGFVRFFTIIAGCIVITLQVIYESVIMIFWWLIPALPIAGFILLAIGWIPKWM